MQLNANNKMQTFPWLKQLSPFQLTDGHHGIHAITIYGWDHVGCGSDLSVMDSNFALLVQHTSAMSKCTEVTLAL